MCESVSEHSLEQVEAHLRRRAEVRQVDVVTVVAEEPVAAGDQPAERPLGVRPGSLKGSPFPSLDVGGDAIT